MTLLLYAVGEDEARELPAGEGIEGRPLRKLSYEGLAAFVSEPPKRLRSTETTLLEYEQAMECLMAEMPVLPARFGTVLSDEHEVTGLLGERQRDFRAALRLVRGAVELGLRGEWVAPREEPGPAGPGAGTAYMQGRLADRRRARELARDIELSVVDLTRASTLHAGTDPATAFHASYLVGASDVDEFLRRLDGIECATPDVTFTCTGPWPPYSFTTAEAR